jgi:hypothetical protein
MENFTGHLMNFNQDPYGFDLGEVVNVGMRKVDRDLFRIRFGGELFRKLVRRAKTGWAVDSSAAVKTGSAAVSVGIRQCGAAKMNPSK